MLSTLTLVVARSILLLFMVFFCCFDSFVDFSLYMRIVFIKC